MDENILSLLEELSLRSCSEDENFSRDRANNYLSSNYTSSSNVSSPNYEQLANSISDEDLELKNAVNSLFQDLKPTTDRGQASQSDGYDKSKLLIALLGNIDLVTCAVKKINQLVSLGKRMEQIYRSYYINPSVALDMDEVGQLITAFTNIYNSESYVREVNVSRVYQAYCKKLSDIYNSNINRDASGQGDDEMIS